MKTITTLMPTTEPRFNILTSTAEANIYMIAHTFNLQSWNTATVFGFQILPAVDACEHGYGNGQGVLWDVERYGNIFTPLRPIAGDVFPTLLQQHLVKRLP